MYAHPTRMAGSSPAMQSLFGGPASLDFGKLGTLGIQARGMEKDAAMQGELNAKKAEVQGAGLVQAGKYQAEATRAQGQAQGQSAMASGIGSLASGIAGGFGSMGGGGGGGLSSGIGGYSSPASFQTGMNAGMSAGFAQPNWYSM